MIYLWIHDFQLLVFAGVYHVMPVLAQSNKQRFDGEIVLITFSQEFSFDKCSVCCSYVLSIYIIHLVSTPYICVYYLEEVHK